MARIQNKLRSLLLCVVLVVSIFDVSAQTIAVNLAALDGLPITPDNILSYQIVSTKDIDVSIKGIIRYKNTSEYLSYNLDYRLKKGNNTISSQRSTNFQFSSSALKELFNSYRMLPEGTYDYCVTVSSKANSESEPSFDDCIAHRSADAFILNLVAPEDKAKLHEFYPMLSWAVNSPLASQLTYRLRVAPIKAGQNANNAVLRNPPIFEERNIMQPTLVYPVYAKPLQVQTPYAWTVDAYYRGLLLGGSETWTFTIIDDTVKATYPATRSYIDIARENGTTKSFILGEMKLKYVLEKARMDTLKFQLINDKGEQVSLTQESWGVKYGDNRLELNFHEMGNLKHLKTYTLVIRSKSGSSYNLPFTYLNPDYK